MLPKRIFGVFPGIHVEAGFLFNIAMPNVNNRITVLGTSTAATAAAAAAAAAAAVAVVAVVAVIVAAVSQRPQRRLLLLFLVLSCLYCCSTNPHNSCLVLFLISIPLCKIRILRSASESKCPFVNLYNRINLT